MITYSGNVVIDDLSQLERLRNVEPFEAARSLGRACRFAGNTESPLSVLTHSLSVGYYVQQFLLNSGMWKIMTENHFKDVVRHGAGHDSSEAFIGDIPAPFKTQEQRELEHKIQKELFIGWKIGEINEADQKLIKKADNEVVKYEAELYGLRNYSLSKGLRGGADKLAIEAVEWAQSVCPFKYGFYNERAWYDFASVIRTGRVEWFERPL